MQQHINHDLMVAEQSKPWVGVWGNSHDVKMPLSVDALIKSGVGSRKPVKMSELNDPRMLVGDKAYVPDRNEGRSTDASIGICLGCRAAKTKQTLLPSPRSRAIESRRRRWSYEEGLALG